MIYGTLNNDTIFGTATDDFILDLAGDDVVYGGAGDDTLYNDRGDDRLNGEAGNDTFHFHPKTLKMDPERRVFIDGGDGDDSVEFLRSAQDFELRECGDKFVLSVGDGAMKIVLRNVEHIVMSDEVWDL